MKAIRITEPFKTETVELRDPKPAEGEVLLKVRALGLCGSDLNTYRGNNPIVTYPRIPGHEIGAEVLEVNDKSSALKPGDRIAVDPIFPCGRCYACRNGRYNCCTSSQTLGVQRDGSLQEFITLPVSKLHRENALSFEDLAMVEPMCVGYHAIVNRGEASSKDTVLIIGCGPIGIGAIQGAGIKGARVIAADIVDAKLELAKKLGADETINSKTGSLQESIKELTKGEGANLVLDATGIAPVIQQTVDLVSHAGRVVFVGYAKDDVSFTTKTFLTKELDIRGSRNSRDVFPEVLEHVKEGRIKVKELVTQSYAFKDAEESFGFWDKNPGKVAKIVIQND